jgi:type VI secretion system protein ImpC
MEDFHPDRLYARLEVFRDLRKLRRRLSSTGGEGGSRGPDRPAGGGNGGRDGIDADRGNGDAPSAGGGLLDRVVEETSGSNGDEADAIDDPPTTSEELDDFVRRIVGPHLVPEPDPERRAALDRLDRTIAETMRAVLHDPGFQALEASWRGAEFMARRIETGRRLKLALLDVSGEELRRDLDAEQAPGDSELHRVLVREAGGRDGDAPWSLVVGLHAFGPSDPEVLGRLATLARAAGAPFVGRATLELAGLDVDGETLVPRSGGASGNGEAIDGGREGGSEAWRRLRERPEARWLGLALPRLLLRPPYGESTRPCEAFPFEEAEPYRSESASGEEAAAGPLPHERYLWGEPACACAVLLARSFAASGWNLRPGAHRDLDRLPLHTYTEDDEVRAKPSAEFAMTERVATGLLERGFMPLAWMKGRPSARLLRFQSISRPPQPLAGRWSEG